MLLLQSLDTRGVVDDALSLLLLVAKVIGSHAEQRFIVLQHADASVAVIAEQTTHLACGVVVVNSELVRELPLADGALVAEVLDEVCAALLSFASVPTVVHATERALHRHEIRLVLVGKHACCSTRVNATPMTCAVVVWPPIELRWPTLGTRRGASLFVDVRQDVIRFSADMALCWAPATRPFLPDALPLPFALVNADSAANDARRCLLNLVDVREDVLHPTIVASRPAHVLAATPTTIVQVDLAPRTTKAARRVLLRNADVAQQVTNLVRVKTSFDCHLNSKKKTAQERHAPERPLSTFSGSVQWACVTH